MSKLKHITPLLLLAWIGMTPCLAGDALTEQQVNELLGAIDRASEARDVDAILSHMAEHLEVRLTMPAEAGGEMVMSKAEYATMLRLSLAMATEYSYRREDITIDIAKDGRSATTTDTTIERIVIFGQAIESRTAEQARIELINGKPMIVFLAAQGDIELPRSQR